MPDFSNPHVIRFYTENFEKENCLRMRWFLANLAKAREAARDGVDLRGLTRRLVNRSQMEAELRAFVPYFSANKESRRKGGLMSGDIMIDTEDMLRAACQVRTSVGVMKTKEKLEKYEEVNPEVLYPNEEPKTSRSSDVTEAIRRGGFMCPIDPKIYAYIHKGVPQYGRRAYLAKRSKLNPEDKFYYPECSSWECGWRLGDSRQAAVARRQTVDARRRPAMRQAMYSRVGPQPDHAHYAMPAPLGTDKCQ